MRQTGGEVEAFARGQLNDPVAGFRPALPALNQTELGSLVKMEAQIRQSISCARRQFYRSGPPVIPHYMRTQLVRPRDTVDPKSSIRRSWRCTPTAPSTIPPKMSTIPMM